MGILFLYRAATMPLTIFPITPQMSPCPPDTWRQVISLASAGGLSHDQLCGDHGVSGQTVLLVLGYLTIYQYTSDRVFLLRWVSKAISLGGVVTLFLAHTSYSMEVVIAYLVTTWLWSLYHTLANHPMVREEVKSMWWGKLIIYLETGWNGPVPDKAGCPLPLAWRQKLKVCFGIFNNMHTM